MQFYSDYSFITINSPTNEPLWQQIFNQLSNQDISSFHFTNHCIASNHTPFSICVVHDSHACGTHFHKSFLIFLLTPANVYHLQ